MDDKQNGQIQVKQELDFESEDLAHGDAVVVYNITVWVSHRETLLPTELALCFIVV